MLTGYFAFSDTTRLVQEVTRRGGDFVSGLTGYAAGPGLAQIVASEWLDFGHANTYHRSRRRVTTEREFNRLTAAGRSVVKSGSNPRKIEAEARWFETLPPALRIYAPAYLGMAQAAGEVSYAVEYLHHPTLADLFVFGRLERATWDSILSACDEFLAATSLFPAPSETHADMRGLYLEKILERLSAHAAATGIKLSEPCRLGAAWLPSLERMATLAASRIPEAAPAQMVRMHGDFCFSNIIYDARGDVIRVIDPRGLDQGGGLSPYGDIRYDIAKLHHSAIGRYDLIIAGYYSLSQHGPLELELELPDDPPRRAVADAFLDRRFAGLTPEAAAAHAISVLLFLSMLPLHADDPKRQAALLANAMRLFLELDNPAAGRRAA
ncbi:MAG TPA: phosphotransferase [Acetobacteraceae bacterium]